MRLGVIGGTGLYDLVAGVGETVRVETPYGELPVTVTEHQGRTLFFVNRHGRDHRLPPHRIDPRRHLEALARCGVDAVFAANNVGALNDTLGPGDLVVPHDLVDLSGRSESFHDDEVVHVDLQEPYCPHLRRSLHEAARRATRPPQNLHDRGVYVGVRGPRFETPAEVRWLATLGDLVGMTGCPEATLARERGLCYAALAFVANATASGPIAAEAVRSALHDERERICQILLDAVRHAPEVRDCGCRAAPAAGRLDPRQG